jgi:hypothetical protein
MEVSGQLYAPAILRPVIELPVTIAWEAGWTPETVSTLWKTEISLVPAGHQTPTVEPVVGRYTD